MVMSMKNMMTMRVMMINKVAVWHNTLKIAQWSISCCNDGNDNDRKDEQEGNIDQHLIAVLSVSWSGELCVSLGHLDVHLHHLCLLHTPWICCGPLVRLVSIFVIVFLFVIVFVFVLVFVAQKLSWWYCSTTVRTYTHFRDGSMITVNSALSKCGIHLTRLKTWNASVAVYLQWFNPTLSATFFCCP